MYAPGAPALAAANLMPFCASRAPFVLPSSPLCESCASGSLPITTTLPVTAGPQVSRFATAAAIGVGLVKHVGPSIGRVSPRISARYVANCARSEERRVGEE